MYSKTKYDESGLGTTHLNYYDQYHHYYIQSFLLTSLGTKTENKNHRTKEPVEFSNKIGMPHTAALQGGIPMPTVTLCSWEVCPLKLCNMETCSNPPSSKGCPATRSWLQTR